MRKLKQQTKLLNDEANNLKQSHKEKDDLLGSLTDKFSSFDGLDIDALKAELLKHQEELSRYGKQLRNHDERISELENQGRPGNLTSIPGNLTSNPGNLTSNPHSHTQGSDHTNREAVDDLIISDILKDLEERLNNLEKNSDSEKRLSELEKKSDSHDNMLRDLARKLDRVEDLVRSSNKDDILKDLARKIATLEDLTRALEDRNSKNETDIQQIKDDMALLRKVIKQIEDVLRQKVDADDFDALRSLLQSLGTNGSSAAPASAIPTKDLNMLKDLKRKFDEMEQSMKEITSFNPDSLTDILNRLAKLESAIKHKAEQRELDELRDLIKKLAGDFSRLESWFREMENRGAGVKAVVEPVESSSSSGSQVDNSKLNLLVRRISTLEDIIQNLNIPPGCDLTKIMDELNRLSAGLKELREMLDRLMKEMNSRFKDLSERGSNRDEFLRLLKELEERLNEKIIEIADAIGKKFADKGDTKKALKYLERLIREYIESFKERKEGDDAMLARKPLGGWSCASCEKNLETLMGRKAPYQPWAKMPYRDPADRIARVGPGFSRMLATVQPELLSNRTRTSQYRAHSPITPPQETEEFEVNPAESVSLPPVRGADRPPSQQS
jgi:tetratricopeptide (TPR) repeat protein